MSIEHYPDEANEAAADEALCGNATGPEPWAKEVEAQLKALQDVLVEINPNNHDQEDTVPRGRAGYVDRRNAKIFSTRWTQWQREGRDERW
ncbi:MAG: hypothetical protein Q7U76_12720 [Nitrospirota bacterium]|nr:hypothetical protein [Nitrospirota bacterium]